MKEIAQSRERKKERTEQGWKKNKKVQKKADVRWQNQTPEETKVL